MKLVFTLNFTDFLEHQLYFSSKSELVKKDRKKKRIIVPIIYIVFSLVLILLEKKVLAYVFFGFSIFWYFIHPLYAKFRYKRHYKKHVNENYKKRVGKQVEVYINRDENFIETSDLSIQTKINTAEFEKLIELKEYFFLRLKSEVSIIIPKREVADKEKFKKLFSNINLE